MYTCKSCGSGLRFDIELQKLKCDACEQTFHPMEIVKDSDGEKSEISVNVFECPQCGGLLYSDDTSIADYCTFCGGHTVFTSRIEKQNRPKKIIPFKITKEEVRNSYAKYLKSAIYAPSSLKKIGDKQDFRAIYMPYWNYKVTASEDIFLAVNDMKQTGNSEPSYYKLTATGVYEDRVYDASVSFSDDISMRLAPFDANGIEEFTPSYLCGFYADTTDVHPYTYQNLVTDKDYSDFSGRVTREIWRDDSEYPFRRSQVARGQKNIANTESNIAMLPVWFFSYQKGKRVAYATVNGQTGKIDTDLPISGVKFAIGTLIIMAILFGIFTGLFTLKPAFLLTLCTIILTIITCIYKSEIANIFRREYNLDDKGYMSTNYQKVAALDQYANNMYINDKFIKWYSKSMFGEMIIFLADTIEAFEEQVDDMKRFGFDPTIIVLPLIWATTLGIFVYVAWIMPIIGWLPFALITFGVSYLSLKFVVKIKSIKGFGVFSTIVATLLAGVILIINPVFDLYYYIGAAVVLLATLISAIDMIHGYNVLATRPLPEYSRKRGGKNV